MTMTMTTTMMTMHYSSNITTNIFWGEKEGEKSVVVVLLNFLAVAGQFRRSQTLRFVVTFQTVPIPSLTSPCSVNFAQFFGFLILEN